MTVATRTLVIACLACGHVGLDNILDLGETPLANALLRADELDRPESRYPLCLGFCPECCLLQITVSVPPDQLFTDYAYFSSYAPSVVANAAELVARTLRDRRLGADNLAVEIASNDGYLLENYVRAGVPVLGIEPAANIARVAAERGVRTVAKFFSEELAEEMYAQGVRADVLHANNVLAHVPDPNGVMRGMARLLAVGGEAIVETPYVRDLIDGVEFDTIYHEHLFYYSLSALRGLALRNGLEVVDVERIPLHGGSLRVTLARADERGPSPRVASLLAEEEAIGLGQTAYFLGFADRVEGVCAALRDFVLSERSLGKRFACYGAAAKGVTLLNTLNLPAGTFEFAVDRSAVKQGRFMPGTRLPIFGPERLLDEPAPEYLLLLAWNYAEEIMEQLEEYARDGGHFVLPVPELTIL